METQSYIIILALCLAFNGAMLALIWVELYKQRTRSHDLANQVQRMFSGLTVVALEHEQRISKMESTPFRPAALLEKLEAKEVKYKLSD